MSEVLFKELEEKENCIRNMGCEILIEDEIKRLKQLAESGAITASEKVYLATLERELLIIKHMGTTAISSTGLTIAEWEKELENSRVYVIDRNYMNELVSAKEKIDKLKTLITI